MWDVVVSDSLGALSLSSASESKSKSWLDRPFQDNYPKTKLVRLTFTKKQLTDSWALESRKDLSKSCLKNPVVSLESTCRDYQYIYASVASSLAESSPMQGLKKIDVRSGQESEVRWTLFCICFIFFVDYAPPYLQWFPEHSYEFLGDPTYAPRTPKHRTKDEDDGFILAFISNGRDMTTEFVIFNAKDIPTGPVYRQKLSCFVSPGVSGSYVDGLSYEQPANVIRRFTACNALDKKNWNQVSGEICDNSEMFVFFTLSIHTSQHAGGFSGLGLNLLAD